MSQPTPQNSGCITGFTRWFSLLMILGLMAGGAAAIQSSLKEFRVSKEASSWPETQATVEKATVDQISGRNGSSPSRTYAYTVYLEYRFSANGQEYTAKHPAPKQAEHSESAREADAVAAEYKAGTTVPVYYDPANPAESRLERHPFSTGLLVFMLVLGVLAEVGGLAAGWYLLFRFGKS